MGQKLEKEIEKARRYSRRYSHAARVEKEVEAEIEKQKLHFRPESLKELVESTHFTRKEIQLLYRSFKEEFVKGLSTLSRGSSTEKLEWIFELYDSHQKGFITKPDLLRVVKCIYELMGNNSEPPVTPEDIMEHVQDIFTRMDVNNDGKISLEEFLDLCRRDTAIWQSLELFNTIWVQNKTLQ